MKNCLKIHFLQDLSKSRFSLKKALKKKGDNFMDVLEPVLKIFMN